jgi:hypothetical protein
MARITGKNGRVKIDTVTVASISDWSLDLKVPLADATAMEDQFKVNLSLIREWSGSISGHYESAGVNDMVLDTFLNATTDGGPQSGKVTLELFPDASATEKFSGDAFLDVTLNVGKDKTNEFSAKVTGTGTLTRTP